MTEDLTKVVKEKDELIEHLKAISTQREEQHQSELGRVRDNYTKLKEEYSIVNEKLTTLQNELRSTKTLLEQVKHGREEYHQAFIELKRKYEPTGRPRT